MQSYYINLEILKNVFEKLDKKYTEGFSFDESKLFMYANTLNILKCYPFTHPISYQSYHLEDKFLTNLDSLIDYMVTYIKDNNYYPKTIEFFYSLLTVKAINETLNFKNPTIIDSYYLKNKHLLRFDLLKISNKMIYTLNDLSVLDDLFLNQYKFSYASRYFSISLKKFKEILKKPFYMILFYQIEDLFHTLKYKDFTYRNLKKNADINLDEVFLLIDKSVTKSLEYINKLNNRLYYNKKV